MSRKCQVSHRCANNAYSVSHSHTRTKRLQNVNLQKKKFWSVNKSQWITLRISSRSMKNRHLLKI